MDSHLLYGYHLREVVAIKFFLNSTCLTKKYILYKPHCRSINAIEFRV